MILDLCCDIQMTGSKFDMGIIAELFIVWKKYILLILVVDGMKISHPALAIYSNQTLYPNGVYHYIAYFWGSEIHD